MGLVGPRVAVCGPSCCQSPLLTVVFCGFSGWGWGGEVKPLTGLLVGRSLGKTASSRLALWCLCAWVPGTWTSSVLVLFPGPTSGP